jgi:predicted anti-sigma-YlaC factor YlaD
MNCHAAQRLVSAARDGELGGPDRAALDGHLAGCAGCRRMSEALAEAAGAWKSRDAAAAVPDAKLEWQRLQRKLSPASVPTSRSGVWWGLSLAAAAGLALALWTPRPAAVSDGQLVEVGDGQASATVYVDAQSGWLVVWAVDDADRI